MLLRPDEFSNLTLCLELFHLLKVCLGYIGKYLRGSGAENIWTENEIFGPTTTEGVLLGLHYVSSLEGMSLLSEAIERDSSGERFLMTVKSIGVLSCFSFRGK